MKNKTKNFLLNIYQFILILALVAFVLTSNITLFLHLFSVNAGIAFTEENIRLAALFTFWNAVFLSVVLAFADFIRRKIVVEKPVKKILEATDRITSGDFDTRIEVNRFLMSVNEYDSISRNINKMASELSGIETLRSDFVASVSHEMKTPLAVLQNYGTLLKSSDLSEEKRIEYADAIIRTSSRFSELVSSILQLNKLENQSISPNKKRCCISEHLCESILDFETAWDSKKLNIEIDIQDDVYIETDKDLLSVAWNNLISNAIKFTPEGGKIKIVLVDNGESVAVSFSDTGCGMTPETGKRIFEKFYQGDNSHSTNGNGLGLSIVKRIVDILDGEISVESILDRGSVFTVKLKK